MQVKSLAEALYLHNFFRNFHGSDLSEVRIIGVYAVLGWRTSCLP